MKKSASKKKSARRQFARGVEAKKTGREFASKKGARKAGKKFAARKAALERSADSRLALSKRFARVKERDPSLALPRFVERANKIAATYAPAGGPEDGRVTNEFTPRTIRHYQARGIIDSPEKEGKEARYGYRHLLQAVLVRVLLAEGFRGPGLKRILAGKSNEEYESFLEGASGAMRKAVLARAEGGCSPEADRGPWARVKVGPGIEIHMAVGFCPNTPEETRELRQRVGEALIGEVRFRRQRRRAREAAA